MKKFTMFAALAMVMVFALSSVASDLPKVTMGNSTDHGGSASFAKASGDTIDVMGPSGSGSAYIGDFESGWNGWTSYDITQPTVSEWKISDYNQHNEAPGDLAAWCGSLIFDACSASDTLGGYGNSWHDLLGFRQTVANSTISANVQIIADLQHDTEGGYDWTRLSYKKQGELGFTDVVSWDGTGRVAVNETFTYLPTELIDGSDVFVVWRIQSDGGWSDADCSFFGAGAAQLDDMQVLITQIGETTFDSGVQDFQTRPPFYVDDLVSVQPQGEWFITFPDGVGDFAELWTGLEDADPCNTNYTQQVAFIDDGVVVPGTGGTQCISWCYGPAGYIVNNSGGLAGPGSHIQVDIESPAMTWPNNTFDGVNFRFDVYRHEEFTSSDAGIFYTWGIRSADTDDSAGNGVQVLADATYFDRNFVYFGGPDYVRAGDDVTDLMQPGRDEIQLRLGIYELGWAWGVGGSDGTPAPYFDNVSVKVFPYNGPGMSTREIDRAQDGFPAIDIIDFGNLGTMSVRFDMANNISLATHLRNDPGDSMTLDIVPVRTGAVLAGAPTMHYVIDANPVFNTWRVTPTVGVVAGVPASGISGIIPDKFAFDLPDTGTLFPGDVLHYYIKAGDDQLGDIQFSTLPANLDGFGDFSGAMSYNSGYTVRALPSINPDGFGGFEIPGVLHWNDFANRGGENEWYSAYNNLGMKLGRDYDIYYTNGPSSGVGNGIGGRTSGLSLVGYEDMVYTSGNLGTSTLSNGDFNFDAGNDIGAVTFWLSLGNALDGYKDLFLTGDDLVSNLVSDAGPQGLTFAEDIMGLTLDDSNIRPFIAGQATPLVVASAGNPVFLTATDWIAYGGCFGINTFDAVRATGATAQRLAEFTDANGDIGAYTFAAASLNLYNTGNRVVSMPYDLMYIYTNSGAKVAAPLAARAQVLGDVLTYFGVVFDPNEISGATPSAIVLSSKNHPNPFNPATKISYNSAAKSHKSIMVYNVRGQLVKTLLDEVAPASGFVMWDGTNNQGASVASGVYFYEVRDGMQVQVNKMALVK